MSRGLRNPAVNFAINNTWLLHEDLVHLSPPEKQAPFSAQSYPQAPKNPLFLLGSKWTFCTCNLAVLKTANICLTAREIGRTFSTQIGKSTPSGRVHPSLPSMAQYGPVLPQGPAMHPAWCAKGNRSCSFRHIISVYKLNE